MEQKMTFFFQDAYTESAVVVDIILTLMNFLYFWFVDSKHGMTDQLSQNGKKVFILSF